MFGSSGEGAHLEAYIHEAIEAEKAFESEF